MALRSLWDGATQIDSALVVLFPGPTSASGEDLAELHLHGGSAVVSGVLAAVTGVAGVRLAEPGEFTRRAFANGRLDLAQVEGLADLIAAETSTQRDQALALTGGALSTLAESWRTRCIAILAEAEAALDFAEEEADVAARIDVAAHDRLAALSSELAALLADAGRAARIRDGLVIAVVGAPNVGKSSLVNALSMRDAAIVTPVAGTTRDLIEVPIDLNGIAAALIDTAGLRETRDPAEVEGIRRARARAASADLVLHVIASGDTLPVMEARQWLLVNKIDLAAAPVGVIGISVTKNSGIGSLRQALADWAVTVVRPGEPALLSQARHRAAFADAADALAAAALTDDMVLRTECLRVAAHAFGRISGRVAVDDVLDQIFSRFCIGK